MNVVDQNGLRGFLQAELARRCDRNGRYSLRAFARYLAVDTSTLSKILHGRVQVADRLLARVCERLDVAPERFVHAPLAKANEYARVDEAAFAELSAWYSYAILELTHAREFRPDERWVARRLGITAHQVRAAKAHLVRRGLLEVDPRGRWRDISLAATSSYRARTTSRARRAMQRDLLEIARAKLDSVPIDERDQSSLILRFARRDLDEARAAITRFRREFDRRFGASACADSVYCLSLSLFPLTHTEGEKP